MALGVKDIKNRFSTTHFVLDDPDGRAQGGRGDPAPQPQGTRLYLNRSFRVIHEVGFRPLDHQEANLFFRLVSARYEKGTIILTSQQARARLARDLRRRRDPHHRDRRGGGDKRGDTITTAPLFSINNHPTRLPRADPSRPTQDNCAIPCVSDMLPPQRNPSHDLGYHHEARRRL